MDPRAVPSRSGPTQRDVNSSDEAFAQTFLAYGFQISSASEQRVDDAAVPLLAPALVEEVIDLHGREPLAVMAIAGHGIKRVGHRDNACFERNLLAGEAVGISRSIHPLMVIFDAIDHLGAEFQGYYHLCSLEGMIASLNPLPFASRIGFDAHPDIPDIM